MDTRRRALVIAGVMVGVAALVLGALAVFHPRVLELAARGEVHELRPHASHARSAPSQRRPLLILAIDGVDRALLYEMLRAGELPNVAALLGGQAGATFAHACFEERLVTVLPSTTIPAWTTVFTGVAPGVHGITGNELFVREERAMVAPAPVSIADISPTLALYTDDTLGRLLDVPTLYDQLRQDDPEARIWVAMSQIYRGADRLILAKRSVIAGASEAFLRDALGSASARGVYAELDEEVIDSVTEELEGTPGDEQPDVLTVYLAGADLFAHHATAGPDVARRGYLREILDPRLARLRRALDERGFLSDAHVVALSDHGHTDVLHDETHALSTEGPDEPPELVRRAGFRVRPFAWKVDDDADFQAVLAYNGAMAFVYVADRSTCSDPGQRCEWARSARWREDVLPLADAFYRADADGTTIPALRGTLDMILVRRDELEPFSVYTGSRVVPLAAYLDDHPRPEYVALASRLRALGAGPHGNRAGDILLVARNGAVDSAQQRYYFAAQYRSWHGSPSRQDSDVPLVVAHPRRTAAELCADVTGALGPEPRMDGVARLFLQLRERPSDRSLRAPGPTP